MIEGIEKGSVHEENVFIYKFKQELKSINLRHNNVIFCFKWVISKISTNYCKFFIVIYFF